MRPHGPPDGDGAAEPYCRVQATFIQGTSNAKVVIGTTLIYMGITNTPAKNASNIN